MLLFDDHYKPGYYGKLWIVNTSSHEEIDVFVSYQTQSRDGLEEFGHFRFAQIPVGVDHDVTVPTTSVEGVGRKV